MIEFDSMDAISEGFHYQFAELRDARLANEWYAANYNSLLPQIPSTQNGLKLLRPDESTDDLVVYPYHKLASDFIGQAAIAEMPGYGSADTGVMEWLDENFIYVDRALRRATRYWQIHDEAVLTAEVGANDMPLIRASDPTNYIRIGELSQPDALVGHVLIYPYRQPESLAEQKQHTNQRPNRVKVVKFIQDQLSVVEEYMFDGVLVFGRMISREESPIRAVCVAGNRHGWYKESGGIVARLLITQSLIIRAINRYENRMRFIPPSLLTYLRAAGNDRTPKTITELGRAIESVVNPYAPTGERQDESPPVFSAELLDLVHHLAVYNTNLDLFFLISGVPPNAFGIGVGKNESGVSREMGQNAAGSRARAYRRDLSQCLPELCVAAGMPDMPVAFSWVGTPFESETDRSTRIMELFKAGIVDRNEARSMMGLTEAEDDEEMMQDGNPGDIPISERPDSGAQRGGVRAAGGSQR